MAADTNTTTGTIDHVQQQPQPFERGGFEGHHGGKHHKAIFAPHSQALLDLLKLTQDELCTMMQEGKTLAEIAAAQNVERQAVIDLLVKEHEAHLQEMITNGRITAEQAEQMKTHFATMAEQQVDAKPGSFGFGKGHGKGGHGKFFLKHSSQALLDLLKLTQDELRTQQQAGKTLAEIAAAQGVERQALIDLLVQQHNAHLDQHVTEGKLTEEQAAQMKEQSAALTEQLVDSKLGDRKMFKLVPPTTEAPQGDVLQANPTPSPTLQILPFNGNVTAL